MACAACPSSFLTFAIVSGLNGQSKYASEFLILFIYLKINKGKSREAEVKRINKELANIRSKFKGLF